MFIITSDYTSPADRLGVNPLTGTLSVLAEAGESFDTENLNT